MNKASESENDTKVTKKKIENENENEEEEKENQEEVKNDTDIIIKDSILPVSHKISQEKLDKIQQLKMKINEARKLNNKAVIEEESRLNDSNFEKKLKRAKWEEKKKEIDAQFKLKGIDPDKSYLDNTATKVENDQGHKKKKHEAFGWDGIFRYSCN